MSITVNNIKQYNAQLAEYQEKAKNLELEKNMAEREIKRLCKELTEEIGIEVTPENAEALYAEYMQKVQNTLETGEEIFNRIKAEAEFAEEVAF